MNTVVAQRPAARTCDTCSRLARFVSPASSLSSTVLRLLLVKLLRGDNCALSRCKHSVEDEQVALLQRSCKLSITALDLVSPASLVSC